MISLIQTAEGALNETHAILQRMRELAVQAANDTNTLDDRREIQKEVEQLKSEINRISETTEFNTQKLLNGSLGAVGSSDNTAVIKVNSASGLKKGDYDVNVTAAASVKTAAEGSATFDGSSVTNIKDLDLTINGVTIDFSNLTDTATGSDIKAVIDSYSDKTGVVASVNSNKITLSTVEYGSNAKLNLGGTDAAKFGGAVSGGTDATVEITDENGVTEALTGNGQVVNYRGAELTVTGSGTATITVSSSGATLQIGANADQSMTVDINEMSTTTLGNSDVGLVRDIDLQSQSGANDAIKVLDEAIRQVSGERSKLGAFQNRLEHTINNLGTSSENLTAAESRIRDVDYALAA